MKIVNIIGLVFLFSFSACTRGDNERDESNIQYMNPNDILMTIPTIENTLPNTTEEKLEELNLEILEDDWRQVELISSEFIPEINQEIESIKSIFENDTSDLGNGMVAFRNLHVRELIPSPLKPNLATSDLLDSFSNSALGSLSFMFYGRVRDGVCIVANSFQLYGIETNDKLNCLGFYGSSSYAQDEIFETELKAFMTKQNLVLVDWSARLVIEPTDISTYLTPTPSE
ncbi:MAG: hypothetical protein ACI8ZM_000365 [Crocinitomix sp.]|jgi:hypothetical protein